MTAAIPDIGCYPLDGLRHAGKSAHFKLLTSRFKPSPGWKGPSTRHGRQNRRCPTAFLDTAQHPHLAYSVSTDGLFCVPCTLMRTDKVTLVGVPLRDWSNAAKVVQAHYDTTPHKTAVKGAENLQHVHLKQQQSVLDQQTAADDRQKQIRREAMNSICDNILYLARQGLAIRGDDDAKSNFSNLLDLQRKHDKSLDEHLKTAGKNATGKSHRIQNEVIELLGGQVSSDIISRVKKAKWFSLLADESADISNFEQVALIIRYICETLKGIEVREDFLKFTSTTSSKAEPLTQLILSNLIAFGLDLDNMIGQGYDGARNMSGVYSGVQTRISNQLPRAQYVHCRAHNLNRVIIHACTVVPIRNMYNILEQGLKFLTGSPKRQAIYLAQTDGKCKLHKFSDTRWPDHSEQAGTFIKQTTPIVDTLTVIRNDDDAKVAAEATSLFYSIQSWDFIICLHIAYELMSHLNPISVALQAEDMDLVRTAERCNDVIKYLETKRDNSKASFAPIFKKAATYAAEEYGTTPSKPRTTRRQTQRANAPAETPEEYWRINAYIPFLDHLNTEMRERMVLALPRLKAEYLMPHKIHELEPEIWDEIKAEYSGLCPSPSSLDSELEMWVDDLDSGRKDPSDLCACVADTKFLPNLNTIFRVLLTMPVTTATCERSFSTLRRIKDWLRNRMTDERLTSLSLLHIHRDIPVSTQKCVDDLDNGKRRII